MFTSRVECIFSPLPLHFLPRHSHILRTIYMLIKKIIIWSPEFNITNKICILSSHLTFLLAVSRHLNFTIILFQSSTFFTHKNTNFILPPFYLSPNGATSVHPSAQASNIGVNLIFFLLLYFLIQITSKFYWFFFQAKSPNYLFCFLSPMPPT